MKIRAWKTATPHHLLLFVLMILLLMPVAGYAGDLSFSFVVSGNEYATITSDREIRYTSFKVNRPYRLVVDIEGSSSEAAELVGKNAHLARVSVNPTSTGSRLVVEPVGTMPLGVKQVSKNVLAVIGIPETAAAPPIGASAVAVPQSSRQAPAAAVPSPSVSATSLVIRDNAVIIGTSAFVENVSTFSFPESNRLLFILKDTKHAFKEGRYPLGFLNLSDVEVEQEGANTKLTFTVKPGKAIPNYLSTKDPSGVTIRFFPVEEPKPADQAAGSPNSRKITHDTNPELRSTTPKYKGQKISLDFDNADLKQIFRLLSEVNKKNYVLSDDVKGTLSIKLNNVPWDQAFDLILRVNNLAAIEEGNIVEIISQNQKVDRIKKQLEVEDFTKSRENVDICAVQLRHASAPKVAVAATAILKSGAKSPTREETAKVQARTTSATPRNEIAPGLEPPSDARQYREQEQQKESQIQPLEFNKIHAEPNSNRLIIRDLPSKFPEILRILSLLDVPDQQVMIEARIVQASSDFTRSLGVQWGIHYRDGSASFAGINSLDTGFGGLIDRVTPVTGFQDAAQAGIGTGISFGTLTSNINLDLRLSAAADMNMAKVISTPRIATTYGETANIKDGTQYPYAKTDGLSGQVTYEFKDAVLSLDVTPTITPACDVIMKVEVTNDSLGNPINGQVPINKKTAKTTLSIKNGETAVIGGTYINDETEGEAGVPYLMDIPFFGKLFKSKQSSKRNRELLIFLTPRLLNASCTDSDVMKLKYNKLECSTI